MRSKQAFSFKIDSPIMNFQHRAFALPWYYLSDRSWLSFLPSFLGGLYYYASEPKMMICDRVIDNWRCNLRFLYLHSAPRITLPEWLFMGHISKHSISLDQRHSNPLFYCGANNSFNAPFDQILHKVLISAQAEIEWKKWKRRQMSVLKMANCGTALK